MTCPDLPTLERAIVRHSEGLTISRSDSLWLSYAEFLGYFEKRARAPLTCHHFIIGASFTYSWMPTMLTFRRPRAAASASAIPDFDAGVSILNDARAEVELGPERIRALADIVNNSVVGASKLLHFVAPGRFAIWDSRVAAYLGTRVKGGLNGAAQYVAYNDCCLTLATSTALAPVVKRISSKVGYPVSPVRAIELVMYDADGRGLTFRND